MKQSHPLDELIRQRIATLPDAAPRGWDELADRLDATADATLAGKLATLTPAAPATGSWQDLAGKLDALEGTAGGNAIDARVTTALQQATPTVVSGWALLAARLELTGRRREMVGCVKVTEAALILSLLVVLLRFSPQVTTTSPTPVLAAALTDTSFPLPTTETKQEVSTDATPRFLLPAVATTPQRSTSSVAPVEVKKYIPQSVHATKAPPVALPGQTVTDLVTNAYHAFDFGTHRLPELNPIATGLLGKGPIRYYLDLFVSPVDVNDVFTFENRSIGVLEDRRIFSTGFSFGALLDVTQDKNGLQTGLTYGKRSYVPAEILNLEQDPLITNPEDQVRYGRLTYHTVSLPLNYERELKRNDRWRISGGVGMAMNVILKSEFRLDSDATLDDLDEAMDFFVSNYVEEGRQRQPRMASARSRASVRRPDPGYLEKDGSLLENSSLYVSGNLRVERLLNERMSFYFSPTVGRLVTVRKFEGGKGPLADRIHNTMFRFGTRIRLTDK